MPKYFIRGMGLLFCVILVGCASSRVTRRFYVEERPRPDLEITGNAGYVYGQPQEVKRPPKTTRKFYVVEFSLAPPEKEKVAPAETQGKETSPQRRSVPEEPTGKFKTYPGTNIVIPAGKDQAGGPRGGTVTYTVQKDDTLQSISMRYYKTTREWVKIYKANKEKIADPDRIHPGLVLTIPLD